MRPRLESPELKPLSTLRFDSLGCSKGGRKLFQNIHCTLEAGRWLHVVGVNGIGKTSLLRMLCGLAPIESGAILWNDVPIQKQRADFQRDLCYLGHLNGLQESMTVRENLAFTAALGGFSTDEGSIRSILARFGVPGRGEHLVRHLSQGQKRRVALCRLALSQAPLWVLDEPFVAMDDTGIQMLTGLIAEHLANGGLTVLTSHQAVEIGAIPVQILELRA